MNQAASVDRVQFHPGLLGREDTDINLAMKGFCSPVGGVSLLFHYKLCMSTHPIHSNSLQGGSCSCKLAVELMQVNEWIFDPQQLRYLTKRYTNTIV